MRFLRWVDRTSGMRCLRWINRKFGPIWLVPVIVLIVNAAAVQGGIPLRNLYIRRGPYPYAEVLTGLPVALGIFAIIVGALGVTGAFLLPTIDRPLRQADRSTVASLTALSYGIDGLILGVLPPALYSFGDSYSWAWTILIAFAIVSKSIMLHYALNRWSDYSSARRDIAKFATRAPALQLIAGIAIALRSSAQAASVLLAASLLLLPITIELLMVLTGSPRDQPSTTTDPARPRRLRRSDYSLAQASPGSESKAPVAQRQTVTEKGTQRLRLWRYDYTLAVPASAAGKSNDGAFRQELRAGNK